MTLRIALVGNSHLAALRQGWDQIRPEYPDCQIDCFGAPGPVWRRMRLGPDMGLSLPEDAPVDPALREGMQRAFGATSINLSGHDAVVRVGDSLGEQDHAGMLAGFAIDGLAVTEGRLDMPRLSARAYAACCAALATAALPARQWCNWVSPRLYMVAMPRPVETCTNRPGPRMRQWVDLARMAAGTGAALDAYLPRVGAALAEAGITLIAPPGGLQGPSGLTRATFGRGSASLITGKPLGEDEPRHMNAAYGAAVLRAVLDRLHADLRPAALLRGVA